MGTFGGALEARQIDASDGRLECDAVGIVEPEDDVLVIQEIHVTYQLELDDPENRETAERVLGFHQEQCPVARSLTPCIEITTELEFP